MVRSDKLDLMSESNIMTMDIHPIEIGCCAPLDQIDQVKNAGFDFIEINVQDVLCGLEDDATWQAKFTDFDKLPLPALAANRLLPGQFLIVGPDRDLASLETYMQRVLERAARIGVRHIVLGSGRSRRCPDGFSPDNAFEQIVEFGKLSANLAEQHGVTIVVEHLNQSETNMINSLADELRLIERVGSPNLRALIDTYHYGLENETEQAMITLGPVLEHVHLAEPQGRAEPGVVPEGQEPFDFPQFFKTLISLGYTGRLSLEVKWSGPMIDKAPAVIDTLKHQWAQAAAEVLMDRKQ